VKVGSGYYVKILNESGYVEFEPYNLRKMRDMLFCNVLVQEVDSEGEPVMIEEAKLDASTRLEIIRTMTQENATKAKKDRSAAPILQAAIRDALDAATVHETKPKVSSCSLFDIQECGMSGCFD
jgi:hypothetical protein